MSTEVETEKALQGIHEAFEEVKLTKQQAKVAREQGRDMVNQSEQELSNAIEAPADGEIAAMLKLSTIEQAWQRRQEAHEGAKMLKSAARDALSEARRKLETAIKDARQERLPGF